MKPLAALPLIFIAIQQVQAEERIAILKPLVFKANALKEKNYVVDKEKVESSNTIGDALKNITGIQSTSFGPNAGAPVIRSLSGNRVGVIENGEFINGMNAFSGNINIPFDPIFIEKVIVNKNTDNIRYGGNAIGGSVQIESGLIPKKIEEKPNKLDIVFRKGFNDFDVKGFNFNINDQKNWSTNIRYSEYEISSYKIPGNSKAKLCEDQIFSNSGGINSALAASCQKDSRVQHIYNKSSQPYIDKFMTENPDWADGDFSFYTDKPTSIWGGKTYINPKNPEYIPNTPQNTIKKINTDVTPNYFKKLGNSYAQNENIGFGTTYFFDKGFIGLSADKKKSEYGVPGFSLQNQSFADSYETLPVGVKIDQNRFVLNSNFIQPISSAEEISLNFQQLSNKSGEYVGTAKANEYKIDNQLIELIMKQSSFKGLDGILGFSLKNRNIEGSGSQRYLPNVSTISKAIFLQEELNIKQFTLNTGYRFERIEHELQDNDFKLARNASNSRIENRKYNLNQYFIGGEYKVNNFINLKVDYGISERAPEVNELYSSNVHYSVMAQEEGDQNLKPEKSKSLELGMFLNWNNWVMQLVGYQMDFENYMYLSHSGVAVQNRLPLKYWKQTDTDVKGFEIDLIYDFNLAHIGNIKLGGLADFVKNKAVNPTGIRLANDGVYLPNMPTNRYGMFLEWRNDSWKGKISSIYYDEPRYLGKNVIQEVPLSGYNLLEFKIDKKLKIKNASFDIFLNGTNLLNEEARPQNSPLKYIAPLPGRAFQLGITMHI